MEIRILGPLEVVADGHLVDLPSGKARLLLAALVVHANQVLSTDRLFEFLWHGQPPDSAANTLQTYVSHLRRSLEPDRVPRQRGRLLVTREPGYLLAVGRDQVDAVRFERLVGQARLVLPGAPEEAAALLRTALSLWRGEPLAGEHPLRERLSGQLMVALSRAAGHRPEPGLGPAPGGDPPPGPGAGPTPGRQGPRATAGAGAARGGGGPAGRGSTERRPGLGPVRRGAVPLAGGLRPVLRRRRTRSPRG